MKHGEAFKMMWYACKCGHRERIWNSRDGVTPLYTRCPSCGELELAHCDWDKDLRVENPRLNKGQQFWRDGTKEEGRAIVERRIRDYEKNSIISIKVKKRLRDSAEERTDEWKPGWPKLDRYNG